ncbi:hypothetical protein GCM10010211_66750 [Streptomyces albospinus]|uniref:Uncharacterized protein n=1 Tax=Streptomyces albospinus TaxID=285515 RepID=A0ABQ2VJ71_9ACTN|nr:hypothetical protein [Streptomyces albospinus]GGU90722.1 hypothetical protein GCM10010211_66750 [Streptomyces albospinus]
MSYGVVPYRVVPYRTVCGGTCAVPGAAADTREELSHPASPSPGVAHTRARPLTG